MSLPHPTATAARVPLAAWSMHDVQVRCAALARSVLSVAVSWLPKLGGTFVHFLHLPRLSGSQCLLGFKAATKRQLAHITTR